MSKKLRGGIAHDPQFFVRDDLEGVIFSVRSKEPRQWKRIFRAFKDRIPSDYRDAVQTEGEWIWEVWPLTDEILVKDKMETIAEILSSIFENFPSAYLCWQESPTLPGFEEVKGGNRKS